MGNGIAHVCALAGYSVMLNDVSPDRIKASLATINGNMTRQVAKKTISEDARKNALALIKPAEKYDALSRLRPGDRDRDREGRGQAQDLRGSVRLAQAGSHRRHQHLVDLDHAAGLVHRPAGAFHRHSFHESGAADGTGRGDPRHRHRRRDLRDQQGLRQQARQDHRGVGGFSGLHRQPHPAADDQRGDLHALRRRRQRRGDRHRDAARRASSDGAARSSPISSASTPVCR